ncbi:hypothetical protein BJ138DRAFT_1157611 [Hygrophoropsis aurantiaca]|uniref:Uncharacterized protein n=1 Tax=Hygrophoropsis aurantiaca TaxID=72124 RepID=A0ACB8A5Y8_9AGAM|nr:hypothetical protein BJ138DRAFT_1157611 [Hygrophoropsis aurantiaca]
MSSPPEAPLGTAGTNIARGYDGQFVGILLATCFTGIIIVQGWIYMNNNQDSWMLRCLVFFLILADFTINALDLKVMHRNLVQNFGDLEALDQARLDIIFEYAFSVIVVFLVQLFFLTRVYLIKKERWWLPISIGAFAVGGFVTGIMAVHLLDKHPRVAFITSTQSKILVGINGAFSVAADVLITLCLTWSLSTAEDGVKRSDKILQKLLRYTVSRGLLVTVAQLLFLILYFANPDALWWVPFHFILSKLYVITMFYRLNERASTRAWEEQYQTSTSMFTHSEPLQYRRRINVHKSMELTQFDEEDGEEGNAIEGEFKPESALV